MKNLLLIAVIIFMCVACQEKQPSKENGQEQVPGPVLNSGPGTEAQRAMQAVRDSSSYDTTSKPPRGQSDSIRPR